MKSAAEQIRAIADDGGYFIAAGRDILLMEHADLPSMDTWMSVTGVTRDDFRNLEVPAGKQKTGIAVPAYDCCSFNWSSASKDGAVATRSLAGFDWINVARPTTMEPPAQEGGPMRVMVDKHHTMGFEAGRTLSVMELDGKCYVEVVGAGTDDDTLVVPEGATLKTLELTKPLIVELPSPTTETFFWFHKGREIRSFQGPVELPEEL